MLGDLPPHQHHIRDRYLPGMLAGELFGGVCISEPDVGSNVFTGKVKEIACFGSYNTYIVQATDDAKFAEALQGALAWGNVQAQQRNTEDLQALRASGHCRLHTIHAAQRQRLRQALEPVYQGLAQRIGPQWLVQLEKERAAA